MKKFLSNFLKIAITVFLFWWLSRSVNIKDLWTYFRSIPLWMILTILGFGVINVAGQALRFLYSVHLLMPPFTFKEGLVAHFSGFAFRLILPGSVGEIGKIFLFWHKHLFTVSQNVVYVGFLFNIFCFLSDISLIG